jgi:DNA-directed RNA polymerase specialized sigma24 family protein
MTDADLVAALKSLGEASAREAAARAIRLWLEREAVKIRVAPSARDDVVQRVLVTLFERRTSVSSVARPTGYVGRMLENARNDEWRRSKRLAPLDPEYDAPGESQPNVDDRWLEMVRTLFERMLARATQGRAERYRGELDRDARVVLALALGEVRTDDLIAAEGVDGPESRKTTIARFQQRQSRTRRELRIAASDLRAAGLIDDEELRILLGICANRISCQKTPPVASS